MLGRILEKVRTLWPSAFIIWDPIVKASAGFEFHGDAQRTALVELLHSIDLVTPNVPEACYLSGSQGQAALQCLASHAAVLLKGGHSEDAEVCTDTLSYQGAFFEFTSQRISSEDRHGSGCTLSAAILAYLALGFELPEACKHAKILTEQFFRAGSRKLGYLP